MGAILLPVLCWYLVVFASRLVNGGPTSQGWKPRSACTAAAFESSLPSGASIEKVAHVAEGGSYGEGSANLQYPTNPTGLPELCAVTVKVASSSSSSYRFGLFLPAAAGWKQKFLAVGNGGFGGGINWLDMAPGPHYGMATVSTDTGHNSSVTDMSWANHQPEKKTDWGWRSLHGSVELGKKLTEAYYGKSIKYSYYNGCSTGGRQGLKEVQTSPGSFDGALIGAPSWYVDHINPLVMRLGMYNLPVDDPKHIPMSLFKPLGREVVKQCDEADGVKDGIVSAPDACEFDFAKIQCGRPSVNASSCLTELQIGTMKNILGDFYTEDGKFLYPGLLLGAEDQWNILLGADVPSPFGVQYVQHFLYDDASWDWHTYNDTVIYDAIRLDPGKATADQYDISKFKDRGGKLVMYHGMADGLVDTKGSRLYYNRTIEAMGNTDAWFRYFEVAGMQHCGFTAVGAPWNFGGSSQSGAMGAGEWSVPGFKDAQHDAMMALMQWVEQGQRVDSLIATTWNSQLNASSGVLAQRPICPYPKIPKYKGSGDVKAASSWSCP